MRSKKQQEKLESLSTGPDIPEDVQRCWFDVVRRAQSACAGNNGFGLLTINVVVNEGEAIMWLPPDIQRIEPSRLAQEVELSPEIMTALATLLTSGNGHKS